MPSLFWTGRISLPLKLLVNAGSLVAWITGNARNIPAMKQRMKDGYSGNYTDHVHHYDEMGSSHYVKISEKLIAKVDCRGKEIIDVGCGTGILSILALEKGASKLTCVDISKLMLDECRAKIAGRGFKDKSVAYHEADAEKLPVHDNSFDVVFFNMVLGMIPNQQETIKELTRVLRPGGIIALSAHGPAYYKEAIEAGLKSMNLLYFLDHRFEFWPRDENEIKDLFIKASLDEIHTERLVWVDEFENGSEVFDFFASTSSLWWFGRLPVNKRVHEAEKLRSYFQRKNITRITSDVVLAYAIK